MQIIPTGEHYCVEPVRAKRVTKQGIHLPESQTLRADGRIGRVLGVGPGKLKPDGTREPMSAKEGDIILYAAGFEFAGSPDSPSRTIVKEKDLCAILVGAPIEETRPGLILHGPNE